MGFRCGLMSRESGKGRHLRKIERVPYALLILNSVVFNVSLEAYIQSFLRNCCGLFLKKIVLKVLLFVLR